jgi:hypothetical protein
MRHQRRNRDKMISIVFGCLLLFACGSDAQGPGVARAPTGDSLCAGRADDTYTSGQPDHLGCPNTCSCLCSGGLCYENTCTTIGGCADPPVYR